jgi:hypothetical protein
MANQRSGCGFEIDEASIANAPDTPNLVMAIVWFWVYSAILPARSSEIDGSGMNSRHGSA